MNFSKDLLSTRLLAILLLSFYFLNPLSAQNNYQPGYIILHNGDTVKGLINQQKWEKYAGQVFFKDENRITHKYSPKNIKGFATEKRNFISAGIFTEVGNSNINKLTYNENLELVADTVFLETIIKGKKSLHYYYNTIGKEQFYINQDGNFELLKHKRFLRLVEGKPNVFEDKSYMKQIADYLDDCPETRMKVHETAYSYKSLEKIFMVYYTCKGNIVQFKKEKEKIRLFYGVLGGITQTQINFYSRYFSYLVDGNSSPSTNITAGGFFEIGLGRSKRNLFLNNELLYTGYSFDIKHKDYLDANNYTNTNSTLAYSYIRLNNMVRYKLYLRAFTLFANFGISNAFSLSKTNKSSVEKKFFTSHTTEEGKALEEVRSIESGWNLGAGVQMKKIMVQLRFESTNGMSSYESLTSRLHKTYILIGYQL